MDVPGRELSGFHQALEYLTQANQVQGGELEASRCQSARGKDVLVIGGGDTGSDCVGTANRQGARSVRQFEILPKPAPWAESRNPGWPWWPAILRTSTSHEEGCQRDWGIATVRLEGADGRLTRGCFERVSWERGAGGGPPRIAPVAGSAFTLNVDMVLLAMGFLHVRHDRLVADLGVECDARGSLSTGAAASAPHATSEAGVFAAGDAATGPSLVVRSIAGGRQAAAELDAYLRG